MNMSTTMKKNSFFLLIMIIIIGCSTEQTQDDAPIVIKDIYFSQVFDRAPQENDFQVEIELEGVVSEENLKQEISYEWIIEFLKFDIDDVLTGNLLQSEDGEKTFEATDDLNETINEINTYFIEQSNNSLRSLLSVYTPGYYKITLQASNTKEIKEHAVILKIGEPELPALQVKINVPELKDLKAEDYRGKVYLLINNSGTLKNKLLEIQTGDVKDGWLDTGIGINPFMSFNIKAGTHILNDEKIEVATFYNSSHPDTTGSGDGIKYYIDNINNKKIIDNNPIVIRNSEEKGIFVLIKEGVKEWASGEIFVGFLSWGLDDDDNDVFEYYEDSLTNSKKSISINLENKYLTKVFVGSLGHKAMANDYYIYFGPEGCNLEELDPKSKRDYPGLPYGYLLGRLGDEGTVFPVSNYYFYTNRDTTVIYEQDKTSNFVPIK